METKAILTTEEQIEHLIAKGITFNLCSIEEAYDYLRFHNNYFKLASYRKNYDKHTRGVNKGKYIGLDFAYLQDLSTIDMNLRYSMIHMSLDIEHHMKLAMLREIEKHESNGYSIVNDFRNSLDKAQLNICTKQIQQCAFSIYSHDIFEKYEDSLPVWVFLELIPFGQKNNFYKFCAERYQNSNMRKNHYLLKTCKDIRNASGHSNCILNNLRNNTSVLKPSSLIVDKLNKISAISKERKNKMISNNRLQQIVTLLFTYELIVTSTNSFKRSSELLSNLSTRMFENIDYYKNNPLIYSKFDFLKIIIDNLQWLC